MTEKPGWIKIHRKFLDWEWYDDINTKSLFLHLLLTANYQDKNWRGINVKRGQVITGLFSLSEQTRLSVQQLRTSLKKLESTGEISRKATNQYTIITLCKYETYQQDETGSNKRITNEQQTDNKRATTTKEVKKDKKEKNNNLIGDRQEKFKEQIRGYRDKYPTDELNKFYFYWTEPNKSKTKMRFELERTWDLGRRLNYWMNNTRNNGANKKEWSDGDVIEFCKKNKIQILTNAGKITGWGNEFNLVFNKLEEGKWEKRS